MLVNKVFVFEFLAVDGYAAGSVACGEISSLDDVSRTRVMTRRKEGVE